MTDINATLRSLSNPRRAWKRLGGASKYVLYTRVSLQSMPVLFLLLLLFPLLTSELREEVPAWGLGAAFIYFLVVTVFAVLALELQPQLNTRPRRAVGPVFWTGGVITLGGLALSVAMQFSDLPESERTLGAIVGLFLLCTATLAYLPWLPFRWAICLLLTVGAGTVFTGTIGGSLVGWLVPVFFLATVALTVWTVDLVKEVEQSRELEASLRVTEERLRFAQELHDTLGQHLAALSVKAELALALSQRGDDRLEGELQDLQKLTRASMSDMREVVEGYRAINLATEIEGARSLLSDAGIDLTIDGDAGDVAEQYRELAAWFVREAATNVLRHADASAVQLSMTLEAVLMRNDGAHNGIGRLSGLNALRNRAENNGAHLVVDRAGTTFTATLQLEATA